MKPNWAELNALVDLAYHLGYFEWADKLTREIARLRDVYEDCKAAN